MSEFPHSFVIVVFSIDGQLMIVKHGVLLFLISSKILLTDISCETPSLLVSCRISFLHSKTRRNCWYSRWLFCVNNPISCPEWDDNSMASLRFVTSVNPFLHHAQVLYWNSMLRCLIFHQCLSVSCFSQILLRWQKSITCEILRLLNLWVLWLSRLQW